MRQAVRKVGYRRLSQREPVILVPGNWTREEWAVLCKLSGLPADRTERIVLHIREMAAHIRSGKGSIRQPGHACVPPVKVSIVVKDGQVSEVYAKGGAVQVTVLDLDTDELLRNTRLQRQHATLLKGAASGRITDIL